MDFEQVRHKASVGCLNKRWCTEDPFVHVTRMVPHNSLPGQEDGM